MPHETFCRREPRMFLDAFRGPFAFYGFSCGPCCSEEFRCVVPGGATSNQNDSHGGEFAPHPPTLIPFFRHWFWTLSPSLNATCNRSRANATFFLFYFAARQTLRARVLLILCFSGSGGSARERKKIETKTNAGFFTPTHTPRAHECLLNSNLIL